MEDFIIPEEIKESINDINKQIKEEKVKPNRDIHKIYRLEEQKLIQGMFSDEPEIFNFKYRSPW